MASLRLSDLNAADAKRFEELLGGIVEDSPWVAREVAGERPFASIEALHAAFCKALENADRDEQLEIIRAHPDLGARLEGMSAASKSEQQDAGLATLGESDRERLRELNDAYRVKFGFPFVVAVKGAGPDDVLVAFEYRLPNDVDAEIREAMAQIGRIVRFRLDDLVTA